MSFQLKHFNLLIKRIGLVYLAFFLTRVLFFIFNFSYFGHFGTLEIIRSFFFALLFDTSAIVYTNSVFILLHLVPVHLRDHRVYQQVLKVIFLVTNSMALFFNLVDTGYFPFSGKRSGMELFNMRNDLSSQAAGYITGYWYLALILVLLVWLMNKYYPKASSQKTNPYTLKQFSGEMLILIGMAGVSFLGARGGWNLKPLNTFDAARFVRTELVALTLNTPFQMIMTVQQTGVEEKQFMPVEVAKYYFDPVHLPVKDCPSPGKPNIVLIIVESLGKEYVGYHNQGKGYTPFVDSLMQQSMVFMHAYANGKRSIEGIPSIIASMPSWMDNDYMNSYYQSNRLKSTGAYLQELGYDASFYHGGMNGTMGFDNFVAVTNGGTYYGKNEYPDKEKDDDGSWGIYDEPYLQYFSRELSKKKEPFFSSVFTLSSHHPYSIPAGRQHLFAPGTLPIHKAVRYADHSLQQFFATARQLPWYRNTIFLITADHSAENELPYYQTTQGNYEIPMFIFSPSTVHEKQVKDTSTIQQLDILPVLLNRVCFPGKYFSFGSAGHGHGFAVQYFNKIYQLVQWPYVYQFDGEKGIAFYNLQPDPLMNRNLLGEKQEHVKQQQMDSLLKSVIQQYNHALITNHTVIQ